jgi:DNA mismatch repair protein MutS2
MEHNDLISLAARIGINLTALSEEKVRDLLGRVEVADIDGLAEIVAIEKKKAHQLILVYNERTAGIQERKVLRTPDARKLARDLLLVFSEHASSRLAKNRFSLLAPATRRETIQSRLSVCPNGIDILRELEQHGRREELSKLLTEVSFDPSPPRKKQQPSNNNRAESDTLEYFVSRRSIIRAVHSILTGFGELRTLSSFFEGTEKKALEEVMKALEEHEGKQTQGAEAALSDAEILINEKLREGSKKGGRRIDEEMAREVIEERVDEIVGILRMNSEEEDEVRRAALEGMSIPFEFERTARRRAIDKWEARQRQERAAKLARTELSLKRYWAVVDDAVERAVSLDQMLATASVMQRYGLTIPTIGNEGDAFIGGRNLFLVKETLEDGRKKEGEEEVKPVSYSLGTTTSVKIAGARRRNVVMLTGANSGGKTTLLTTLASIHILALLGLPVPCERAEVAPLPIYLFRRRVTRKIGSLEHALNSLIPVFADRHRKLVLMDEFEALTEPGAAGRILGGIMNAVATGSSLLLLVTHLARETLPHVRLPIRVDGIEAEGLDTEGDLIVVRQPKFDHIGSSTPKLIIMKLAKSAKKKNDKALYGDILNSLEAESSVPVQAPISLPWLSEEPSKNE